MSSLDTVRAALVEAQFGLQNLMSDTETLGLVAQAGELLAETFAKGGRVFSCGNGGSMSDAIVGTLSPQPRPPARRRDQRCGTFDLHRE